VGIWSDLVEFGDVEASGEDLAVGADGEVLEPGAWVGVMVDLCYWELGEDSGEG
jgi:hypothetical protein